MQYFKSSIALILVGILLLIRFSNLDIDLNDIFLFSIYYVLGTGVLIFSAFKFKSYVNPLAAYSLFIYLLSYSFIRLSKDQALYSSDTLLLINLSIVSFIFAAVFEYDYRPIRLFKLNNSLRRSLVLLIITGALVTFIIECLRFGYVPLFNISTVDVYIETNEKLVPFLHYFIVLLAFMPSWGYILYKHQVFSKKSFLVIIILTTFILLNYLSRQLYLLTGTSFFLSYLFYHNIQKKVIIQLSLLGLTLFIFVGYLKFNSDNTDSFSEFMRLVAGIDNENVTILESTITEYSSKRFTSLDRMVDFKNKIDFWGAGSYTLRPLLSLFMLEKTGVIKRFTELDSERQVGTYIIDPYLDFGLIGAICLNALYGFLAIRYYKQYKKRYPEASIKYSIILFCILMGMFINYFNTMLIWMGIFFNKLIMGGMNHKTNLTEEIKK